MDKQFSNFEFFGKSEHRKQANFFFSITIRNT
jgi:hypothetical protein